MANDVNKAIARRILAKGALTVAELARHFRTSPQLVKYWAGGIDIAAARATFISRTIARHRPRQ
jgi:hypothetical protein